MSPGEHPSEVEARRLEALDDLLASPNPLPESVEARLLAIPDRSRPALRSWRVAAAAVVLVAGAVALQLAGRPESVGPGAGVPRPAEPSRGERVAVALLHPSETGRAFLESEGERILVTLHRLARDRDPNVAVPAIERLGVLSRRSSLPVLVDVVRRPDRRGAAIRALARLRDPSASATVAPYLADPELHTVARDALAAMGGKEAVVALILALDDAEEPGDLVAAIGRVPGAAGTRGLLDLLSRPALEATLREALADPRHRLPLLDAAGGRDPVRALAAIRTLEHLGASDAVGVLRLLLADGSRREAAARALAAIDTPEAGAALLDGLGARGVREALAYAGPGIETWLLARLEAGARCERRRIICLLALCGGQESVPVLARLASDPALAPDVVETLGRIGGPASIDALEALADRTALRRSVVLALATTASTEAVPALVRLGRSDRALRRPVIAALGGIPHPDAVRAILSLDGSATTRRTTARTLCAMDRDTVVPTLVAMLDGDEAAEARRWLQTVRP